MDTFFTWQLLATYSGATSATVIVVELAKGRMKHLVPRLPTRTLVYIVALVIMVSSDFALPPAPTFSSIVLDLINACGVALTAMGGYHQLLERLEARMRARVEARLAERAAAPSAMAGSEPPGDPPAQAPSVIEKKEA